MFSSCDDKNYRCQQHVPVGAWSIFGSPTRSVEKRGVSAVGPQEALLAALPRTLGYPPLTLITGRSLLVPCTARNVRAGVDNYVRVEA